MLGKPFSCPSPSTVPWWPWEHTVLAKVKGPRVLSTSLWGAVLGTWLGPAQAPLCEAGAGWEADSVLYWALPCTPPVSSELQTWFLQLHSRGLHASPRLEELLSTEFLPLEGSFLPTRWPVSTLLPTSAVLRCVHVSCQADGCLASALHGPGWCPTQAGPRLASG